MNALLRLLVRTLAVCTLFMVGSADAARREVPLRAPQQLLEMSTDVVLARVLPDVEIETSTDGGWSRRDFTFSLLVEDVEKGGAKRGDRIEATAWHRAWVGLGDPPPSSAGHRPLPLAGEVARFHLRRTDDGVLEVVLPNGVELATSADPLDPVRYGEPPRVEPDEGDAPEDAAAKTPADPFGWEIILILLALPVLVGSLKQPGKARWTLLGVSLVMFVAAALIAIS
ncbi:MAG TPA: hypothetical protein DCG14_08755 [Phycisphaerales bacterium]|nr:hypothetical protein [Phycisphaerales bacterium]